MQNYLIVIPARLKSKRLPNKPLLDLNGLPMIIRTANQCAKVVTKKKIIIATDSNKIKKVCENFGYQSLLTSKKCLTGTDRVFEVAKKIKANLYINLQGDEPIFNPLDIKKFIKEATRHKNIILNGYSKISNKDEYFNINIPKLVFNLKKELIYISRAPIPGNKKKVFIEAYKQICIYSFPKKVINFFSKIRFKSKFEQIEDIEIIRFLEFGYKIKMIKLSSRSFAIDTKKDLIKVRKVLKK